MATTPAPPLQPPSALCPPLSSNEPTTIISRQIHQYMKQPSVGRHSRRPFMIEFAIIIDRRGELIDLLIH